MYLLPSQILIVRRNAVNKYDKFYAKALPLTSIDAINSVVNYSVNTIIARYALATLRTLNLIARN